MNTLLSPGLPVSGLILFLKFPTKKLLQKVTAVAWVYGSQTSA